MFTKKKLRTRKTTEKEFEYNLFAQTVDAGNDDGLQKNASPKLSYNFITADGALQAGYGFTELKSPTSTTDVENESLVTLRGTEIKSIWKLKWYNLSMDENYYYIFYYNNENLICYDNLFMQRFLTLTIENTFTEVPYATHYRSNSDDALLLSGEGGNLMVVSGDGVETISDAPVIKSCCSHYGRLFAITASAASTLVYNEDVDIENWTDEKTKNLDFSDERGDLNVLVAFNDYVYIFRDYGITKVSLYGADEEFAIAHQYKSDSYIFPNTISQSGDRVYFLERTGLKSFNGSSVSDVDLDCEELFTNCDQSNSFGTCFEGKYYLACKCDFGDGKAVGCESGDYVNNALIVYDFATKHVDITRGVDINELLALNNPYLPKLVACFRNQYKGKIGQLTRDGKIFGTSLANLWQSVKTDFGLHGRRKRIKSFTIKSLGDCKVVISSERDSREYNITGKDQIQRIVANVVGNEFDIKIVADDDEIKINNFVVKLGVAN